MGLANIAVRCLFVYLTLLLMLRLKGKRAVAQATPFDFVLALILGDMMDDLFWAEVPASQFVAGIAALLITDALVSWLTAVSRKAFVTFNGPPRIFIRQGEVQPGQLAKELITEKELEGLSRMQGVDRSHWPDIHLGVLEIDSHLSILRTKPAQRLEHREADGLEKKGE